MRAFQMNQLSKKIQSHPPLSAEQKKVDCSKDCLEIADEYWKIGSAQLQLFLQASNPPIKISEDMNHAIVALKIARGLYQKNKANDQAQKVQALLEAVAEKFLSIGRKLIEPQLKASTQKELSSIEIEKGIAALTYAAEVYEIIGSWGDAVFAWSMIKAVPTDQTILAEAAKRMQACEDKLSSNTGKKDGSKLSFFPYPPVASSAPQPVRQSELDRL